MPNHLASETSPYLLQHADNPVDWYPWGAEALNKAKDEDKPIFLSIGYAACHWCHVMAHESFEDPATAELMNRHYVCIKVDREERPDLDSIYMQATVGMTGQGGWPMSVFLTPDGVPFYAGTYFPNTPRMGMPSFRQVLTALAEAWANQRDDVQRTTGSLLEFYQQESEALATQQGAAPDAQVMAGAVQTLSSSFDRMEGGWGRAPKFPQPMTLEFLLAYYARTKDANALAMAETTLTKMAQGGMYDQLGGGFHRYSTDGAWLVPHFEKMLYDNSQLARVYLHAWQVTGNPLYRRVCVETLDYVLREMTDPSGGFYSTQDADSEGEEGKYFVWAADELWQLLGDEAVLFNDVYGVTRHGNFEGKNILHQARSMGEVARQHNLSEEKLAQLLAEAKQKLLAARHQRIAPARDEKVLTAWNGLMLAAFAEAARVLDRADYRQAAIRNADFLLATLRTSEGRLYRTWKPDHDAKLNGYLEDYAHLCEGLLALYQTSYDARYFVAARELGEQMLRHFAAPEGLFYDTSDDHEALVTRPRDMQDNAVPAGNSMAATVCLRLAALTGEERYRQVAEAGLRSLQAKLAPHASAFGQWLIAQVLATDEGLEVALVGDPNASQTQDMLQLVHRLYQPAMVTALKRPAEQSPVPLLEGREAIDERATAYVCRHFACQRPVNQPEDLRKQLAQE
jgi:uncharacterized protein YyaL (SSP411 family)